MTTRLSILFSGSPEDETQSFHEIVGRGYESIPFSQFVKWRLASKDTNTWALDIDVVPLARPKIVYILAGESSLRSDIDQSVIEITNGNSVPIRLDGENDMRRDQRVSLQKTCVMVCDRVLVINSNLDVDGEVQEIIDFANEANVRVTYLKY